MKAFTATIVAATLTLAATPAIAEKFVLTTMDVAEGRMSAIDLETVRPVNGYKRAWWTVAVNVDTPQGSYAQELLEFDCVQQRSRQISLQLFDMANQPTATEGQQDWQYFTPKSAGDYALQYACGSMTPPPTAILEMTASALVASFGRVVHSSKIKNK